MSVRIFIRMLLVGCLGGSFFLVGCASKKINPEHVRSAYEKAEASLRAEPRIEVDVLWLLNELAAVDGDESISSLVAERKAGMKGHPYMVLVDASAPRIPLPADPGKGMDRFFAYMMAPFGEPEGLAVKYVTDFVSTPQRGYILTHQFFAILWAERSGLVLPPHVINLRQGLLDRIYQEQLAEGDKDGVDLYAERAALVMRYGRPYRKDVNEWVSYLIENQLFDGGWPSSQPVLKYDGQFGSSTFPPSHTTSLAMMVLKIYLLNYVPVN